MARPRNLVAATVLLPGPSSNRLASWRLDFVGCTAPARATRKHGFPASALEPEVQRAGESVRAHRGLPADGGHDHRHAVDQARRMACTDALMSAQAGLRTSWQGHSSMTNTAGLKRRGCGRPLRGGATRAVCTLQSVCWRYAVPRCVHTCSCLLRAVGDTLGSISHMDAEQLRAAAPGVPIWVREYRQLGANH